MFQRAASSIVRRADANRQNAVGQNRVVSTDDKYSVGENSGIDTNGALFPSDPSLTAGLLLSATTKSWSPWLVQNVGDNGGTSVDDGDADGGDALGGAKGSNAAGESGVGGKLISSTVSVQICVGGHAIDVQIGHIVSVHWQSSCAGAAFAGGLDSTATGADGRCRRGSFSKQAGRRRGLQASLHGLCGSASGGFAPSGLAGVAQGGKGGVVRGSGSANGRSALTGAGGVVIPGKPGVVIGGGSAHGGSASVGRRHDGLKIPGLSIPGLSGLGVSVKAGTATQGEPDISTGCESANGGLALGRRPDN
ncbi:hypothetical protein BN946_scf184979.g37 [Trametes cinnabarina]|uniref:Uncharacterized protein n=1 Tax=Pycnoporus cinnabarinus TaxID=5643 RepID=A0A060SIZ9_PYCCI|nr:hypothetical protein BN946_scf184979.g37 [Trametes cinnabarina]